MLVTIFYILLQNKYVSHPFQHIYGDYGFYCDHTFGYNHTSTLCDVATTCSKYMEETFGHYLLHEGFGNVEEYSDHIFSHPDNLDWLAILLTAMLNHVHLCVHHPGGAWHTHVDSECVCALQLTHMGELTFVALEAIEPDDSPGPVVAYEVQLSTQETHDTLAAATDPDLYKWVNCKPFEYPTPCSEQFHNRVFSSSKQLMEKCNTEKAKDNNNAVSECSSDDDTPLIHLKTKKMEKQQSETRHGPPRAAKKSKTQPCVSKKNTATYSEATTIKKEKSSHQCSQTGLSVQDMQAKLCNKV